MKNFLRILLDFLRILFGCNVTYLNREKVWMKILFIQIFWIKGTWLEICTPVEFRRNLFFRWCRETFPSEFTWGVERMF